MLKVEVLETLLYGCMTWTNNNPYHDRLLRVHHSMFFRYLVEKNGSTTTTHCHTPTGSLRKLPDDRIDEAQIEDVVWGIRGTYGGGDSSTEGDIWRAYWG